MSALFHVVPKEELLRDYIRLSTEHVRRIAASRDAEALFEYGSRLRNSDRAELNEAEGWQFIEAAAKLGHPVALGLCFFYGQGVEEDRQRAFELFESAAQQSNARGKIPSYTKP
jgi:TPR repeat protein